MIVITAPTGNIGRQLLSLLVEAAPARGEEVRVVVRDPARLPESVQGRVEVVTGSHGDAATVERAFTGADAVFWLVPPDASATPDEAFSGFTRPAARAFAAGGVGHVVGVSALGRGTPYAAQAGLVTASLAMDDLIAGSGVAYRALACPSFFENLLEEAGSIRENGVFTDTVAADRPAPLVAVADIAATAAGLLLDRSWTGVGSVPVLGPQALSPDDLARIMTEELGRPVRYQRQPLDELRSTLLGYGPITDLRERAQAYPPALSTALVDGLWEAIFSVDLARCGAAGTDPAYAAGCLFRAIGVACQALHGHADQWLINEKGMLTSADRLPVAPRNFAARAQRLLSHIGESAQRIEHTVNEAATLVDEVKTALGR